mgnify:FL=1
MPNEIRALENFNPIQGLDEKPMPANVQGDTGQKPKAMDDDLRVKAIIERVSGRLDRKAKLAVTKIRSRYQGQEREEREAEFWENHAKEIADDLAMSEEAALCLMHTRRRERAA